jgi:nucleoside-diphosphate-sugar epimerase
MWVVIAMFYESIASGGDTPISGEAGLRVTGFIEEVREQIEAPERASVQAQSTERLSLESQQREAHPKILVTGGTGFLGSHLVTRLVQEGHEVRVLARKMSRLDHLPKKGIQVVFGDLRDAESLCRAMQGIEVVYHAAAAMGGSWEDFEDGTIRGTERLLEVSLAAGVKRFVHISSLSVYEAAGYKRNSVIHESSPYPKDPLKIGPYTYSKVESERLAFEYYKKGLPVTVLRPGLIYGPRGKILYPLLATHCRANYLC